jgi:hypothetical protein
MRKENRAIKTILYIKRLKIVMASPAVEKTKQIYLILKVKNVLNLIPMISDEFMF